MCCLLSRCWHSHRLLARKLSSLLLPAFPLPAKCTMTPPPPCPFPFLFSSSDSLFLCTVFCICCCQLAPPLSTSPDHKQTTPQRSSLWVSLAVSSAPHHALLPFAAIPTAVPPPLPLSSVCTCSLRGCFIGVDSARTIGAAVSNDRTFTLGLDRCGIWLPSNVQLGNGVGRQCDAILSPAVSLLLLQHCVCVCTCVYVCVCADECL